MTTLLLLALLVLMASLPAVLTSTATAGTRAHASTSKAKPKALRCKALISPGLLTEEVTGETGVAPEVEPATEENKPGIAGTSLKLCSMFFTNGGIGNATAYGNFPYIIAPPFYWYAGTAVTTKEFNHLYDAEESGSTLGTSSNGPFSKKRIPSLGYGSRAFVRTDDVSETDTNPAYQDIYGLYVLSKGKNGKPGNLIILYAWPLSLEREELIVKGLLAKKSF